VAGLAAWNSLLLDIRTASTLATFGSQHICFIQVTTLFHQTCFNSFPLTIRGVELSFSISSFCRLYCLKFSLKLVNFSRRYEGKPKKRFFLKAGRCEYCSLICHNIDVLFCVILTFFLQQQ